MFHCALKIREIMSLVRLKKISNISVSQLWSFTIAIRNTPKGFFKPNPISFVRNNEAEIFVLKSDLEKFSLSIKENNIELNPFFSYWKNQYESAKASLNDLDSLNFSSLSNEILNKIYSIVVSQSSENARMFFFSEMIRATNSNLDSIISSFLSSNSISKEEIFSLSLNLFKEKMFEEIGKRIYKRKEEMFLMSPEEFYPSLYGGVFDESEIEERKSNYIVVYDLEKDAPHIYSGEKARAMEVSMKMNIK